MKKAVTAGLLAASLILTGCADTAQSSAPESVAAPQSENNEKHLVILGDSISAGYGMEDPDTQRYGAVLCDLLNADSPDETWHEYNYALAGDDSSDLLYRLDVGRAVRLPSADTIIICIGANNMLGAYTDYLRELLGDRDVMNMTDEELSHLEEELMEQVQNDANAEQKLEQGITNGLDRLRTDLEKIYTWIRERNQDADIYVMNVYNPYAGVTDTLPNIDRPMGEFAQEKIDRCNAIISDWEAAHPDLHAVDLAGAFASWKPVPIIGSTGAETVNGAYLDPHPNAEGQKKIAELLYNSIREK